MRYLDPRAWTSKRPGERRKPAPYMRPEEIAADYARREAEQAQRRARLESELAAERARRKAGVPPTNPPPETSLKDFTSTDF